MSTTINPYFYNNKLDILSATTTKSLIKSIIIFTISIPKGAKGYYLSRPFMCVSDKKTNLIVGHPEYEILLPRNNVYEIVNIKKYNNIIFVKNDTLCAK